ncbi:MAPEG family protein [Novosphingobium piscinae]|uniref:MAPEG family protein n=1 Tax=Novosphingobium piscinae TaxID=1507448 RepID=A0A7X1FXX5_9SPHN|nr:MAPEG family protein [Novosphingobium piscinae]MBC2668392.1 MAPEG family protein [Novosphingobium piscinae]
MADELRILVWAAGLLLVHIMVAGQAKTAQYGSAWNVGARDEALPPPDPVVGRLIRAQANFLETLPVAIIGLLLVHLTGRHSPMTALGGWIWLGARTVYLPLYWAGIPLVRTVVYLASLVGLAMVFRPLLG